MPQPSSPSPRNDAMRYRIALHPTQHLATVQFYGQVTGQDIMEATEALLETPGYDDDMDQLWDFEAVRTLIISPEELKTMVAHDQALVEAGAMGHVKVAIVVHGELRTPAARLYQLQMMPSGQDVRLFARREEAEAWLQAPA